MFIINKNFPHFKNDFYDYYSHLDDNVVTYKIIYIKINNNKRFIEYGEIKNYQFINTNCSNLYYQDYKIKKSNDLSISSPKFENPVLSQPKVKQLSDDIPIGSTKICTPFEDFNFLKIISKGGFGKVYLAENKLTKKTVAIKVIKKSDTIKKMMVDQVNIEKTILANYKCNYIVELFSSFQTDKKLFFVMEFLNGGDCASLLRSFNNNMPEDLTKSIIAQIIICLEYLHNHGIIHRDLKPDNILIDSNGHIKLADFGLSKFDLVDESCKKNSSTLNKNDNRTNENQKILGTPYYIPPEVILGKEYGKTIDWWSLGIILYEFLIGHPPFQEDEPNEPINPKLDNDEKNVRIIFNKITNHKKKLYYPKSLYPVSIDLIEKLLDPNPNVRLGANGVDEVKCHPFFSEINWKIYEDQKVLVFQPFVENDRDTSYFIERKEENEKNKINNDIDSLILNQNNHNIYKNNNDNDNNNNDDENNIIDQNLFIDFDFPIY
ncbi:hypothetical protein ACTFIY_008315 [Dictyostelium cf. discoideum]